MGNIVLNISEVAPTTNKYTYKDIKVPLDTTFSANFDVLAIKNAIRNIFSFRPGHRILDPEFGNVLYLYLYEAINDVTINNLEKEVLNMLSYEPRINVLSIVITPLKDNNQINIEVKYLVPTLNYINTYTTSVNLLQK